MENKSQIEIIDLMAENEFLLEKIYLIYANQFESEKEFWQEIAKEEQSHFINLNNFKKYLNENSNIQFKDRFKIEAVRFLNALIKKEIEKAKNQEQELLSVLAVAHNFETSMLESNYLDIFATDSEAVRAYIEILIMDTKAHIAKIKGRLEFEKLKTN